MCGIAGIFHTASTERVDEDRLAGMLEVMRYRGPDASGIYLDSGLGLGHVRLSIIGLTDGTQPLCNEDGTFWIVYNGETFNYIELKADLIKKGHRFSTATDTEVVLHLFEEYGPECLGMMNGEFALAIWDSRNRELFLARDRTGIRPLYYTEAHGKFIFASEIKAIFVHPDVERRLDPRALQQIFTFWATSPPSTVFQGVYSVPPGHYMRVKGGANQITPYWKLPLGPECQPWQGSFEEAAEELASLLTDAVRLRLRADVPVGAYLSGGLDSSIITALISKNFDNRLKTFSLCFEESDFDESSFQSCLIRDLGTEYNQQLIKNAEIGQYLPEVVWHCETPLLRTAPVPMFLLSKLVHDHQFKVVLTGEGADEVFGGYNIFKEAKVRRFCGKQPQSELRPLLLQKLYPYIFKNAGKSKYFLGKFFGVNPEALNDPFFSHLIRWQNNGKNASFFSRELLETLCAYDPIEELRKLLPRNFDQYNWLEKAQHLETDIFLSNYLLSSQGDRVAMAHSLETRLPFLDYRVMAFASRLPAKWKISGLDEKHILKKAAGPLVPSLICNRQKQPYRAPIQEVFFGREPADYMTDLMSENSLKRSGYFNPAKVGMLMDKFLKPGSAPAGEVMNMAFMGVLTTQMVHRQFIESSPGKSAASCKVGKWARQNSFAASRGVAP